MDDQRESKGSSINSYLNFNLSHTELIEVLLDIKSTGNKND